MYRILIPLILFFSLLLSAEMQSQEDMVKVPKLVGLDLGEAREKVLESRLSNVFEPEFTTEYQPGTIFKQNPEPGSLVSLVTTVYLKVATNEMVYVPDVVGQPLENARDSLQSIRLLLSPPYQTVTTEHPPGTVMEQFPPAGSKVGVLTKVTLNVAKRPEMVEVPNLVGQSLENARDSLQSIQLPLILYETVTTEHPPDKVMEQFPTAGSKVGVGTAVSLTVAKRPETVDVPYLVGQPLENARDSLQRIRLILSQYQAVTTEHPPGTVIDQSPVAGSKVRSGTTIFLKVATISMMVDVPDLVGQTLENARDSLQSIRLILVPDSTLTTEHPPGTVMDQSPAAGSKVRVGTTVYLKIALEEPPDPLLTLFYIVLSVIGILVASLQFRRIRKKKSKRKKPIGTLPDIRVISKLHFGFQKIPQKSMVKADIRVRLKAISDKGKQNIVTDDSLILKVPKGESGRENTFAPSVSQIDDMDEAEMQALNSQITEVWQSSKITTLGQLATMLNLNIELKPVWDIGKQDISVEVSLRKKMNIDIK